MWLYLLYYQSDSFQVITVNSFDPPIYFNGMMGDNRECNYNTFIIGPNDSKLTLLHSSDPSPYINAIICDIREMVVFSLILVSLNPQ